MKRILMLLTTVALVMVAMLVAMAVPALAQEDKFILKCQQEGPGTITFHESEGRSFGQDNQDPGPVGYSPRSPTRSPQKSPGSLNSPSTITAGKDVSGSQSISESLSAHTTRSGAELSYARLITSSPCLEQLASSNLPGRAPLSACALLQRDAAVCKAPGPATRGPWFRTLLSGRRKGHPSPPPCNQLLFFADPAL